MTTLKNLNYGELYFCSPKCLSAAETKNVSAAFSQYLDYCDEPEASLLRGFKLTFLVDSEAEGSLFAVRRINIGSIGKYGAFAAWVQEGDYEAALEELMGQMLEISSMECEEVTWVNRRVPIRPAAKFRKCSRIMFEADICPQCHAFEIGALPTEEDAEALGESDKKILIDKDSEAAQFTGIADAEKEKVMDIQLKKEYEKGWFGNAMVSGYNPKTQVTFLGNANNVQDPNGGIMVMWDDSGEMPDLDFSGLPSTYQGGVNVNTTAIKGLQTDVMANYLGNGKVNKSRSTRTTFVTDGTDLIKESEKESSSFSNKVKGAFTLKNADRKKFLFDFTPDFAYTSSRGESHFKSSTTDGTSVLNTSKSENYNKSKDYLANAKLSIGLKDMGKKSRALTLNANYSYNGTDEEKKEYSEVTGSNPEIRDLLYNTDRNYHNINGTLAYVEPLTDTWNLSLQIGGIYRRNKMEKLAYDRPSMDLNDYYYASSDNKYINTSLRLLAQYKKEKTNIQFGAKGETTLNEIFSRAYGVSTATGKNDWFWQFYAVALNRSSR